MTSLQSWTIGSETGCDLVVDQPQVSARHCLLKQTADGLLLEDLDSTNGTFVNGCRITAPVHVANNDKITLGQVTPMPWPATGVCSEPRIIRIGRDQDNDVALDYPMVSSQHAQIVIHNGQMTIEDLGSTNGTFVGTPQNRITRASLKSNEAVFFGSFAISASQLLVMADSNSGKRVSEPRSPQQIPAQSSPPSDSVSVQSAPTAANSNMVLYLVGAGSGVAILVAALAMFAASLSNSQPRASNEFAGGFPSQSIPKDDEKPNAPKTKQQNQKPEAPPLPTIGDDDLLRQCEGGIVWLGVETFNTTHPYGTGWAIDSNRIVSSAGVILTNCDFKDGDELKDDRRKLVVGVSGQVWEAHKHKFHSDFPVDNPLSPNRRLHNLGVLILRTSIESSGLPIASPEELRRVSEQPQLRTIGFASEENDKVFPTNELKLRLIYGKLGESFPSVNGKSLGYTVDMKIPTSMQGSPVFNASGNVIGTLAFASDKVTIVSAWQTSDFSKP